MVLILAFAITVKTGFSIIQGAYLFIYLFNFIFWNMKASN